jgi:hypothetical protein
MSVHAMLIAALAGVTTATTVSAVGSARRCDAG